MKWLLLRLGIILLSFSIGVCSSLLFAAYRHEKADSPVANNIASHGCQSVHELISTKDKLVVIAIPADDEFYIGKDRISLSEIPDEVRNLLGHEPPDKRIVFIKGQPNVKYETVNSVIEKTKEADVNRIEIVPDKKKVSDL